MNGLLAACGAAPASCLLDLVDERHSDDHVAPLADTLEFVLDDADAVLDEDRMTRDRLDVLDLATRTDGELDDGFALLQPLLERLARKGNVAHRLGIGRAGDACGGDGGW